MISILFSTSAIGIRHRRDARYSFVCSGGQCLYCIVVLMCRNRRERPYQHDSTASRPLSEVKHVRAWLVLRWGTTLESQVLFSFSVTNLALFCPSGCYWPTNCGSLNLELYSLPPAFLFLALFYSRGLPMR